MAKHQPVEYGELRLKMENLHRIYYFNNEKLNGTNLLDCLDEIGEDGWRFAFKESERFYFQRFVDEDY